MRFDLFALRDLLWMTPERGRAYRNILLTAQVLAAVVIVIGFTVAWISRIDRLGRILYRLDGIRDCFVWYSGAGLRYCDPSGGAAACIQQRSAALHSTLLPARISVDMFAFGAASIWLGVDCLAGDNGCAISRVAEPFPGG
jgi:hypothetical protein